MIRMINGYTGLGRRLVGPEDGPFELTPEAEARLVALGVAVIVPQDAAVHGVNAGTADRGGDEKGVTEREEGVTERPVPTDAEPGADKRGLSLPVEDCIDVADGHMTEESLLRLTRAQMEALAGDLGLDGKKCRNKAELAALIAQVEVEAGAEPEDGPELSAAMPS